MKQYDALVEAYIKRIEIRGIGTSTIFTRRREIEKFGLWVKRKKPRPKLGEVGSEIILDYLKNRSAFKARSTMQGRFSDLRCFFDFLVEENIWRKNPLRWIRGPKLILNSHVPKCLGQSDVENIFQACFKVKETLFQYELPVIFMMLYSLGIRRGELVSLSLENWNREQKTIKILCSKGNRERFMPVPESLERALEAYLPVRQNLLLTKKIFEEPALFVNKNGHRLTGASVSSLLLGCARRSGLSAFTVHQVRHTCATNLLSRGVPITEVKMVLGHVSIDTTVRYTHVAGPERWNAIHQHPLNDLFKKNIEGGSQCLQT